MAPAPGNWRSKGASEGGTPKRPYGLCQCCWFQDFLAYQSPTACAKYLQHIVPGADELPLLAGFFFAPQQKLPKASCLLDLAENRLRQYLPKPVAPASLLCPQLTPHPVHHGKTFRNPASGSRRQLRSMLCLVRRHVHIYPIGSEVLHCLP